MHAEAEQDRAAYRAHEHREEHEAHDRPDDVVFGCRGKRADPGGERPQRDHGDDDLERDVAYGASYATTHVRPLQAVPQGDEP